MRLKCIATPDGLPFTVGKDYSFSIRIEGGGYETKGDGGKSVVIQHTLGFFEPPGRRTSVKPLPTGASAVRHKFLVESKPGEDDE